MPTIVPISDLRNYTEVLNKVDVDKPVYLTRNGRGTYVISKIDDYDREATIEELMAEIKAGEESAKDGRRLSSEQVAKRLGIKL